MSEIGAAAISPTKVGRNDLCPCGSGKKFKHCCQGKDARGELPPGAVHGSTPTVELRPRLRALVLAAKNHAAAERWSDAVRPLLEVVRLEPKSASAHYDLGVAYLNCGQLDAAAQSLRRALELRPGFTEALGQLALALE